MIKISSYKKYNASLHRMYCSNNRKRSVRLLVKAKDNSKYFYMTVGTLWNYITRTYRQPARLSMGNSACKPWRKVSAYLYTVAEGVSYHYLKNKSEKLKWHIDTDEDE